VKILHLAAGNRWTGAAAPAFAEVEALRAAGVDAHYAYVGGYKLQEKIGHHDFAHALIEKRQHPAAFLRTTKTLERMVRRHGFDVIHAHLTYDHWLARMVARDHDVRIARTFHSRRTMRRDPFTRSLLRQTAHRFIINADFADALPDAVFTPPPLDHRQFTPDGPRAFASDAKVVAVIGKLAPERGFEEALRTFAILHTRAKVNLLIIGHGPHRPALEALASSLGIAGAVRFAGYHEEDLADYYRASNLLLFTARGSDEGHRAVLEAMACGVPPAVFPLEGMRALVPSDCIAAASDPASLAETAAALLIRDDLPRKVYERSFEFGYARAAARLIAVYEAPL
jgi:glycosyltransferase involved in cell wall biosynthesis